MQYFQCVLQILSCVQLFLSLVFHVLRHLLGIIIRCFIPGARIGGNINAADPINNLLIHPVI